MSQGILKWIRRSLMLVLVGGISVSCDKVLDSLKPTDEAKAAAPSEGFKSLGSAHFEAFKNTPGKVVVVDFYADWCGPCHSLSPKLEKLGGEFEGKVLVGKVDVDQEGSLAHRLGVSEIPDVRIYRGGRQVERVIGDIPEDALRAKIEVAVRGLEPPADQETDANKPVESYLKPADKDWMPEGMQRR
ncbi:thioredoxin [Haloferula luteola]|uniref:Thioredoxin n=1 Tax=Haloferula luteola TaxID=595692 RepID=A0A840V9R0_9BACT|nr:thioredoxin family protein [Haloferula luteola]MBB5351428.1 thioredoxin [Haloferula luteola]